MKDFSKKRAIKVLDKILTKAVISKELKDAVIELKAAIEAENYSLAADLSVVKSFVCIRMNPKSSRSHFCEDAETNDRVLGNNVYSILDGMHFDLAMVTHTQPSGIVVVSGNGIEQRKLANPTSPTLSLIVKEQKAIKKHFENMRKSRAAEQTA